MLFRYKIKTKEGETQEGTIESSSLDGAINTLQERDYIVISVLPEKSGSWLGKLNEINITSGVSNRDIVILSRQISTLFEAKVSVLATFRLLSSESANQALQKILTEVADDIKTGISVSQSLARHPKVFSDFYVNMVRSGEESGKLSETFTYLADYLDRTHAMTTKARNALVYPAFVILSFLVVMVLMVAYIIPRLSDIFDETGQELPIYTRAILGLSDFFVNMGPFIIILLIIIVVILIKYIPTPAGQLAISRLKLSFPLANRLYRKLYLSRMADNMNTLLVSGVSMVRSIEITAAVVDNEVYRDILDEAAELVKTGTAFSEALSRSEEIPGIMIQMVKVGEETGKLGYVLDTMAKFYRREVENEIDTLIGLIEPAMIVGLGLMVGVLLTSVLVPIYNLASAF